MRSRSDRTQRLYGSPWRASRTRLAFEQLEERCLLAVPVIDPILSSLVPPNIPANKTLFIPVTGSEANGEAITYSVTSSNPAIQAQVRTTGNTYFQVNVANFGSMTFQLFGDLTPMTVNVISGLVKSGFYNGLTFHRVASGFVIQGGDPKGDGTGGPNFQFDDEFNRGAIFSGVGQLAMANAGHDTNGSQFFATVNSPRFLDFKHTIFGQLVRGFDVMRAINAVPTTPPNDGKPNTPVVISNAAIVQDNHDAVLMLTATGSSGSSTITVSGTDSRGDIAQPQTFQASIIADTTNDPPFLGPIADQATSVNTPITFTLSGTDIDNDPLTFNATLVNPNPNVTVSVAGNQVTVTPINGFVGPVAVQVSVTDLVGTHVPDTQTIIVAVGPRRITGAQATNVNAAAGTAANGVTVATFSDTAIGAQASDYTASINWGDSHITTGTVTGAGGQFAVQGSNTYRNPGSYPVQVTLQLISSLGGNRSILRSTATVTPAPLTAQPTNLTGTTGKPLTNVTVATFTTTDPNRTAADFTASINWGDGVVTPGTINGSNGQFSVAGTHTYSRPGSFSVVSNITQPVQAGDVSPGAATATATATITGSVLATNLFAVGAGPGGVPAVRVYNADGTLRFDFFAFDPAFRGGVHVAVGDVTGDLVPDIIVSAGPGGGPHVKVFDGQTGALIQSFFAYDQGFSGGVFVAVGDVVGQGRAQIITGAGAGGGPHVKVFDSQTGDTLLSFMAYDPSFAAGVSVAAGDVRGQGRAQIITGAGPGGGPHVKVFDGKNGDTLLSFMAYDVGFTGGVSVAAGDVRGQGRAQIITGTGPGGGPHVKVFDGMNLNVLQSFMAFDSLLRTGVQVGVADVTGTGTSAILAGSGPGGGPHVKAINGTTLAEIDSFFAFDPRFKGGIFVGGR